MTVRFSGDTRTFMRNVHDALVRGACIPLDATRPPMIIRADSVNLRRTISVLAARVLHPVATETYRVVDEQVPVMVRTMPFLPSK